VAELSPVRIVITPAVYLVLWGGLSAGVFLAAWACWRELRAIRRAIEEARDG
jgi:hypothetical protein